MIWFAGRHAGIRCGQFSCRPRENDRIRFSGCRNRGSCRSHGSSWIGRGPRCPEWSSICGAGLFELPEWDLDNVVLVVPGGRAGRALIELLVTEAAAARPDTVSASALHGGRFAGVVVRIQASVRQRSGPAVGLDPGGSRRGARQVPTPHSAFSSGDRSCWLDEAGQPAAASTSRVVGRRIGFRGRGRAG